MKKIIALLLALSCTLALFGCSRATHKDRLPTTETESINPVLQFFADQYNMKFKLWGPEGQDLYVFRIYDDHAERECHILMPENTDDIAQYHTDLSWKVANDELIITGEWQETFQIDIIAETATSASTGKVYQICNMDDESQALPTLSLAWLETACADGFYDPSTVTVLSGEWAYTADPDKFVVLATVKQTNKFDEYETSDFVMVGVFGGEIELYHCLNRHSPYTRENALEAYGAVDDRRFPLE